MTAATTCVLVLWATSPRFGRPQFVAGYAEGMVDSMPEMYWEKRTEDEQEWRLFGDASDGPWTFWTEYVDIPLGTPEFAVSDEEQSRP